MSDEMTTERLRECETLEPPDTRGEAIIIHGSVIAGLKFTGPFPTIDDAIKWYGESLYGKVKVPITIALLEKPDSERTTR